MIKIIYASGKASSRSLSLLCFLFVFAFADNNMISNRTLQIHTHGI